jgi:hypothetical protein
MLRAAHFCQQSGGGTEPTYEAGDTCVVELEGRSPDSAESFRMVDIFTVGADGRVERLAVYRR